MAKVEESQKHKIKTKEEEITTIKAATEILNRLNRAFKIAKIYEPNNLLFQKQIEVLLGFIKKALEEDKEASFMLRLSTLFFNGVKIRFGFANYYLFKFISNEFRKREIGVLSFQQGFDKEELTKFIILLAKKGEDSKSSIEDFMSELKQNSINHITLEKIPPFEKLKNKKKDATKIFFLSITHLKESFNQQKEQQKIPLLTTKRLMQSLYNHIVDNESFLYGLTNIKNFDEYTLNHSVNVCILSLSLGKRLGFDRNELVDLGLSAFFHDFGKLDIPKEILVKPGKLDKEERKIIEKHPHYGAEKLIQLRETSYLPMRAINVAMEHHSREDQAGYPKYEKKKSINLFSKIVKVTDVFDAITTKRLYRKKDFTREEALSMMIEKSGIEFDPIILKVFVSMMGAHPIGMLVLLSTGEIGIVFESNPEPAFVFRPKVKIIADNNGKKTDGEVVDLTEVDPQTNKYTRTIIKSLDPYKYNIKTSDYFIIEAE